MLSPCKSKSVCVSCCRKTQITAIYCLPMLSTQKMSLVAEREKTSGQISCWLCEFLWIKDSIIEFNCSMFALQNSLFLYGLFSLIYRYNSKDECPWEANRATHLPDWGSGKKKVKHIALPRADDSKSMSFSFSSIERVARTQNRSGTH